MSIDRRGSAQLRRRRILLQTGSDITTESAAERRAAEKLREARRPTASYGAHVNRRLRGRWFSLVPIRRTTVAICGASILGSAIVLTMLHWAAVTWAPLAYRPELARPFRLDRPDSLGTWAKAFFLAAAAATSLLVYQLRRYKVDDYQGNYRIWRSVIVLIAILSIDSVTNLVPWFGAMIEAMLGRRVALAGADWIRIVLAVGGGALALRLVAEVRTSKLALAMMLVAIAGFLVPLLSRLNLLDATQINGWVAVTSAPLIASAALWFSIGGYLRMLLREVRGLDETRLAPQTEATSMRKASNQEISTADHRSGSWFRRRFGISDSTRAASDASDPKPVRASRLANRAAEKLAAEKTAAEKILAPNVNAKTASAEKPERRSWFGRRWSSAAKTTEAARSPETSHDIAAPRNQDVTLTKPSSESKRRWFAPRKRSADAVVGNAKAERSAKQTAKPEAVKKPAERKRSWFSRSRAETTVDSKAAVPTKPVAASAGPSKALPAEDAKPVRKGLGAWLRRDPSPTPPGAADRLKSAVNAPKTGQHADASDDEDDENSDDSVDWGALNKSERRRMRKEIKRGGRAA